MIFQNASTLWWLLAAAVPVIIHLFNFRRTKKVYFSNVAFLQKVETQTSAFRKIKQWLILAARILAVTCLVLAFAQPFLPSKQSSGLKSGGQTAVYIDNSLSMQNLLDSKTLLDWTVIKIDQLLMGFPRAAQILIGTNDFEADDYNIQNIEAARNKLTTIKYSNTPQSLERILKRQDNLLTRNGSSGGNQHFVFSDFQKSTLGRIDGLKMNPSDKIFLVPIEGESSQNVFVDSTWLASGFIREMQSNVLSVRLKNSGKKDTEKLSVRLFIDEKQASSATTIVPAGGANTVNMNFNVSSKGYHKCRVAFDDQPINFDNDFYFVLNASPIINVLHLYQNKGGFIEKVFQNDSLFNIRTMPATSANVGLFKTANLIILEGLDSPAGSFVGYLDAFIQSGGSVVVFPSAGASAENYRSIFGKYGLNNLQKVNATEAINLAEATKGQAFFADVFETMANSQNIATPAVKPIWYFDGAFNPILSFRSGQAFLGVFENPTKGKVYFCASAAAESHGNFVKHGYFLPTMYKIAANSLPGQKTFYTFEDPSIKLSVVPPKKPEAFKIVNGKTEIVPTQKIDENVLRFQMPSTGQLATVPAGFYDLKVEGKAQQVLAFNHSHQESDLATYSADELRELFKTNKNVEVFDDIKSNSFVSEFKKSNFGTPLWKYSIIAALLFLLAEICLIRWVK